MKKKCLFILLLMSLFTSCDLDGNFGIKDLGNTFLIINNTNDSQIKLYCKSEKIGIPIFEECEDLSDNEEWVSWAKNKELINDNDCFAVFDIPSVQQIDDRNKIRVYFKAEVDDVTYTGDLYIRRLQENSSLFLFREPVILKTQAEETLYAVFTYCFHRSI